MGAAVNRAFNSLLTIEHVILAGSGCFLLEEISQSLETTRRRLLLRM